MNTEFPVHAKLYPYGIAAPNLNRVQWYRSALVMKVNHHSSLPSEAANRTPFSALG